MTMARCREATPPGVHKPAPWRCDDSSELDVFAAERYFNGDDALWCTRSSSSLSSAFRTAATSSSEVSWNSRSALLASDVAAPRVVEAESSETGRERPRGKPASSHLRWLLGVVRCACVGGDSEESGSADHFCRDEVEDDNIVGVGGKKLANGAPTGELFQRTERKELAVAEAISVRVRPGRSLDDGEELLAGKAAFSPVQVQVAGVNGHRRAVVNSGELSTPIMNPATTAALVHEQRRKSAAEMLRPLGDVGSALVPRKQGSAFTIVAGKTAPGGGLHATGRPCLGPCDTGEEDAAPSELGCAYPPSEASVVWSVVTAEGAASCNFSSAASGYYNYYYFDGGEDGAVGRSRRGRRTSGITNGGGLLTCMGDKAVNAVGPASVGRLGARSGSRNMPR